MTGWRLIASRTSPSWIPTSSANELPSTADTSTPPFSLQTHLIAVGRAQVLNLHAQLGRLLAFAAFRPARLIFFAAVIAGDDLGTVRHLDVDVDGLVVAQDGDRHARADRSFRNAVDEIVPVLDGLAVERGDDVAFFEAGACRGRSFRHLLDEHSRGRRRRLSIVRAWLTGKKDADRAARNLARS